MTDPMEAMAQLTEQTAHENADLRLAIGVALVVLDELCLLAPIETERIVGARDCLRNALGPDTCDHNWIDARNQFVDDGEYCSKCFSLRAMLVREKAQG